jgi:hypothetical protein
LRPVTVALNPPLLVVGRGIIGNRIQPARDIYGY